MEQRRIIFSLGVTYQTDPAVLEQIPEWIRGVVESQESVRFDRSHFKTFGDSALVFETVYWVTRPDYGLFMDTQQAINLALFKKFESEGIEFAYPTQTIYLSGNA